MVGGLLAAGLQYLWSILCAAIAVGGAGFLASGAAAGKSLDVTTP